jgi:hypothetical protein
MALTNMKRSRPVAHTVSRRLPTTVARARSQVRLCETCVEQNGTGAGFFRVLQSPLPILIPPIALNSLIILSLMVFSLDNISGVKY